MDENTESILALAWARALGLGDEALAEQNVYRSLITTDRVSVLQLLDRRVLRGPRWLIEQAGTVTNDDLGSASTMLGLLRRHSPRLLVDEQLWYVDDYPPSVEDADEPLAITSDPAAFTELLDRSAPDARAAHADADSSAVFVSLDIRDEPTAAVGWRDWQGIVADLWFLGTPDGVDGRPSRAGAFRDRPGTG